MATKAERRAARERVSAYHESQLAGLLATSGQRSTASAPARSTPMPRTRPSTTITVPPQNCGKFCFARGGGAHVEFIASSTAWPPTRRPSIGGNAPHRDGTHDPTVLRSPRGAGVCHAPWPRLKTAERANRRYARL